MPDALEMAHFALGFVGPEVEIALRLGAEAGALADSSRSVDGRAGTGISTQSSPTAMG